MLHHANTGIPLTPSLTLFGLMEQICLSISNFIKQLGVVVFTVHSASVWDYFMWVNTQTCSSLEPDCICIIASSHALNLYVIWPGSHYVWLQDGECVEHKMQ